MRIPLKHDPARRDDERGSALFLSTLLVVVAVGLSYSTIFVSVSEVKKSRVVAEKTCAFYAAEAGMELGINVLKEYTRKATLADAFQGLDTLFKKPDGSKILTRAYVDHDLVQNGRTYGTVNVQYALASQSKTYRDVTVTVDAYIPNRYSIVDGRRVEKYDACTRIEKTVRVGLESGSVFDYAYFINNWGWFYADSITSNGNVRANGQFDSGNRRPVINGAPRYDGMALTEDPITGAVSVDLKGYRDDNQDGILDGSDGGIYAGWDIAGSSKVRGMAADAKNKHDFQEPLPMPNLNDLSLYEDLAKTRNVGGVVKPSSVHLGGTKVSDAVYGDGLGEKGNLYLHGTPDNPIRLDGPVVVRGNLVISGTVTGQGSFYVKGNIYLPNNLRYLDPPTTWVPSNNSEATTEQWIAANHKKDFCGLFAKEHVVAGDFTNKDWRKHVGGWLGHSLNQSKEDSGSDRIPNTRKGRDGILNTADDDVLEGDGKWTVERYTAADALRGAIPAGLNVGDPIPGTGEDIDGDGQYDGTASLKDFDFSEELTADKWGGNMPPAGVKNHKDIATMKTSRLDGVIYTNHTFAMRSQVAVQFDGALISRNEAIIYGYHFTINHDRRLLGGGSNPNVILPKVFGRIQDLNYMDQAILNLRTTSTAPLVPTTDKRIIDDPTDGDKTGKVLISVDVITK